MHFRLSEKADKNSLGHEPDVTLKGLADGLHHLRAQLGCPITWFVPCVLFEVKKMKMSFRQGNCTCQSISMFGVWLESAAFCYVPSHRAVFRSVFSPLSHTGLLRLNKEAFHIDLDTRPPPSPQEPTQRNPPQLSDINLSVPLADRPSSRLRWTLKRRLMHIIRVCFYSNRENGGGRTP